MWRVQTRAIVPLLLVAVAGAARAGGNDDHNTHDQGNNLEFSSAAPVVTCSPGATSGGTVKFVTTAEEDAAADQVWLNAIVDGASIDDGTIASGITPGGWTRATGADSPPPSREKFATVEYTTFLGNGPHFFQQCGYQSGAPVSPVSGQGRPQKLACGNTISVSVECCKRARFFGKGENTGYLRTWASAATLASVAVVPTAQKYAYALDYALPIQGCEFSHPLSDVNIVGDDGLMLTNFNTPDGCMRKQTNLDGSTTVAFILDGTADYTRPATPASPALMATIKVRTKYVAFNGTQGAQLTFSSDQGELWFGFGSMYKSLASPLDAEIPTDVTYLSFGNGCKDVATGDVATIGREIQAAPIP